MTDLTLPISDEITARPYTADDLSACLEIFDSNVPAFLAPEERIEFCEFLESVNTNDKPYLVLTHQGSLVACGGLIAEADKQQVRLAWGLVNGSLHSCGLGTHLTLARLAMARTIPHITEIGLATSQHTCGFYKKFGFNVLKITPDGFASGFERYDMVLHL